MKRPLAVLVLLLLACSGSLPGGLKPGKKPPSTQTPTTTDPNVALPPREQGGAGGGAAGGSGAGDSPCDKPTPTPAPQGCAMATLKCGDAIVGNNSFGEERFDDAFYQAKFCSPQRNRYDLGPEAVYLLEVPGDYKATVTLATPCADLDIASVGWNDGRSCPTQSSPINECEMGTKEDDADVVVMTTVTKPQTFLVIVDGKKGATGNFELSVACERYR